MLDSFLAQFKNPSLEFIIETIAVISSVMYVILAAKGKYLCFLFGLISSALYLYICLKYKLYFDVIINAFYIIMSIYGWLNWKSNTDLGELKVSKIRPKTLLVWIGGGLVLNILLAEFATRFSDASLPYLDAFTTIFAILGTYLVIKRKIENWLIWIVVDFIASGMYYYKELYLTSLLFFAYTIVAIFGYFNWKKKLSVD